MTTKRVTKKVTKPNMVYVGFNLDSSNGYEEGEVTDYKEFMKPYKYIVEIEIPAKQKVAKKEATKQVSFV